MGGLSILYRHSCACVYTDINNEMEEILCLKKQLKWVSSADIEALLTTRAYLPTTARSLQFAISTKNMPTRQRKCLEMTLPYIRHLTILLSTRGLKRCFSATTFTSTRLTRSVCLSAVSTFSANARQTRLWRKESPL